MPTSKKRKKGASASKETRQDGKVVRRTEHPDGRKDVTIEVNRLDVKEKDPATLKAKEHIEGTIIPALANAEVMVTVVYRHPVDGGVYKFTSRKVKMKDVRKYAQSVVDSFRAGKPDAETGDFIVVEFYPKTEEVKISTLV